MLAPIAALLICFCLTMDFRHVRCRQHSEFRVRGTTCMRRELLAPLQRIQQLLQRGLLHCPYENFSKMLRKAAGNFMGIDPAAQELLERSCFAVLVSTSLEKLWGRRVDSHEVAGCLTQHFGEVFGREMKQASLEELLNTLQRCEQLAPHTSGAAHPEFAVLPAADVPEVHR